MAESKTKTEKWIWDRSERMIDDLTKVISSTEQLSSTPVPLSYRCVVVVSVEGVVVVVVVVVVVAVAVTEQQQQQQQQ